MTVAFAQPKNSVTSCLSPLVVSDTKSRQPLYKSPILLNSSILNPIVSSSDGLGRVDLQNRPPVRAVPGRGPHCSADPARGGCQDVRQVPVAVSGAGAGACCIQVLYT